MRPLHTLVTALAVVVCLPLLSAAPSPVDAPDVAFKEKAKKVLASGKSADMETLVRNDSTQTAAWIVRLDDVLLEREDPGERELRVALASAWDAAIKTAFPARFDEYLKGLDVAARKTRVDLKKRLVTAYQDLDRNRESREGLLFLQTIDQFEVVAGAFEQEGDAYSASEAWLGLAECYDEPLRGTGAELHKAWKAWSKVVELRARFECKDRRFEQAEKRAAELQKRGFDQPGGAAGGEAGGAGAEPAQPPSEAGNPVIVPLTFEVLAGPEAFARPCFQADEIYHLWNPVQLAAKGSSSNFARLDKASPVLHRLGSADLRFDVDGDGKADGPDDQKIVLTGTMTPFRLNIGQGDDARPWAFFAVNGLEQDYYQGVQVNLQPNDDQFTMYTLSAASVVGTLNGTALRVLDDTMDGIYGSADSSYGYAGLTNGVFQPELDSIVIGNSKRARPWSSYQEIGGRWWKMEGGSKGKELLATPANVDTGTIKLEFKGPVAPSWVVVRGTNELKDSFFDLVEGGSKGVKVPAGRYTLYYGEVSKGKKRQIQKTLILPGRTTPNIDVGKNQTAVLSLGAPFDMEFTLKRPEDEQVTIVGESVVVVGKSGERYERPWNCVLRPEASWRKKGSKKGARHEKMPALMDTQTIYDMGQQGWLAVWFPLDLTLETKGVTDAEVQLVEKKHDLFGKIESTWRE